MPTPESVISCVFKSLIFHTITWEVSFVLKIYLSIVKNLWVTIFRKMVETGLDLLLTVDIEQFNLPRRSSFGSSRGLRDEPKVALLAWSVYFTCLAYFTCLSLYLLGIL